MTDPDLTGRCPHCDWRVVAGSYPELVERYHDHLRSDHPDAWLRA